MSDEEIAALGEQVRDHLLGLCSQDLPDVRLVATGPVEIPVALAQLQERTRCRVRNNTVRSPFDASGRTTELNALAHERGISGWRVINARDLTHHVLLPLTSMFADRLVLAPVRQTFIIVDDTLIAFSGAPDVAGEPTMWITTRREAVRAAIDLTDAQFAYGEPVDLLKPTPTNQRRIKVLARLLAGDTDHAIGRRLGVSTRCVEKDVAAVKELAGVGSRSELAWALGLVDHVARAE